MLTISNLHIFSTDPVEKGLCVFDFTKPVLFVNCTFDSSAECFVCENPHLFAVI